MSTLHNITAPPARPAPAWVALLIAVDTAGRVAVQHAALVEGEEPVCRELAAVVGPGLDRVRRDLARHMARQARRGSVA